MPKKKIAVICQKDTLLALYAWNKVFENGDLKNSFDIAGFWNCEEKFYNVKKEDTYKWYLETFGFINFIKLGLFTVLSRTSLIIKSLFFGYRNSFEKLCVANDIRYFTTTNPNAPEFVEWVKKNEIDILVVMVGHILKKEILNAPVICSLNRHSGLLPANKGVLPYFWARLKNQRQGISFHLMTEQIDVGKLAYQEEIENEKLIDSLVSFYFYSHKNYGRMLVTALKNIEREVYITPLSNESSYHGLPSADDYKKFTAVGGKIINWADIFLLTK